MYRDITIDYDRVDALPSNGVINIETHETHETFTSQMSPARAAQLTARLEPCKHCGESELLN